MSRLNGTAPGHRHPTGQRFGHVTGPATPRPPGPAAAGGFQVRDGETGLVYSFGPDDIVTEGLRTARVGERVRFLADPARPGQARYVIRLDVPGAGELYD
jgi:hypothetical protein